jgi:transcriptional regulator with XRE-family HTH domain
MGRNLDEIMDALPKRRQEKIKARSAELLAEYETLQELRKALNVTQEQLADELGMKQANISRLERRPDMLLSTLSRTIAALGGKLDLTVSFEDRPPVRLTKIADAEGLSPVGGWTTPRKPRARRKATARAKEHAA